MINEIIGNEVEVEKSLFFSDVEYFNPKEKEISGDMDFAFTEQRETRNDKSYEENIAITEDWAKSIMEYGIMDEVIEILYICKGNFVDFVEIPNGEEVNEVNAERHFNAISATPTDRGEQIYALALCSPSVGEKHNLEEYVGMKVHYFNPTDFNYDYQSVEDNFLAM